MSATLPVKLPSRTNGMCGDSAQTTNTTVDCIITWMSQMSYPNDFDQTCRYGGVCFARVGLPSSPVISVSFAFYSYTDSVVLVEPHSHNKIKFSLILSLSLYFFLYLYLYIYTYIYICIFIYLNAIIIIAICIDRGHSLLSYMFVMSSFTSIFYVVHILMCFYAIHTVQPTHFNHSNQLNVALRRGGRQDVALCWSKRFDWIGCSNWFDWIEADELNWIEPNAYIYLRTYFHIYIYIYMYIYIYVYIYTKKWAQLSPT